MLPGQANVTLTIGATDKASGVLKRIGGGITGFAKVAAAAVAGAAAAFVGLGALSLKAAISVESAFTGVAKTTDGLVDQFGELTEVGAEIKQGFRDLAKEVPVAVEELLAIGELAGQLGIPKEALVDFTETVAALAETTNLTSEEAAADLARLGNIFQITAGEMAENTAQIGSTIVELGNNFATTERDILAFGTRIAGVGKIVGLTQADVLGIGTAMASVGVEAEAGGTAVQKVLIEMQKAVLETSDELDIFADAAGISAQEFADVFERDAAEAFQLFVRSLGDAGDDAIGILAELGLEDQRLIRSFLSLAGAGDLITRSMDTASEAFETNEALGKEAQLRYGTMESQLAILKNTIKDVGVTIGDFLLPFLKDAVDFVKPFIEELGEKLPQFIEENLLPALEGVGKWFEEDLPVMAEDVKTAVKPITDGLGELVTAFWESTPEIKDAMQEIADFAEDEFATSVLQSFDNIGEGLTGLSELWEENDSIIIELIKIMVQTVLATAGLLLLGLTSIFKIITLVLTGEWQAAWDEILETFDQSMQLLFGLIGIDLDEFKRIWTQALNDISTVITFYLNEWGKLFAVFVADLITGPINEWREGLREIFEFLGLKGSTDTGGSTSSFQPMQEPSGLVSQGSTGAGDTTQMQDHWNLTVNSRARSEDVIQTFAAMKAMRGGAI